LRLANPGARIEHRCKVMVDVWFSFAMALARRIGVLQGPMASKAKKERNVTGCSLGRRVIVTALIAIVFGFGLFANSQHTFAQDVQTLTVQIAAQDDSGVTGTGTFTADGDQTLFDLALDGGETGYEGHIFDSTCDNHQAATVFYSIEPVDDTLTSSSVLDVSFDEITNGSYWIHVHKPGGERGIGVACGLVLEADAVGDELPSAGVGFGSSGNSNMTLLSALFLAVGLFSIGLRLRARDLES